MYEFLIWFLIWGVVAIMVYGSVKEKGMDAGLWAILIFIFGVFGFVFYLFASMNKNPSSTVKTYTTNDHITPQYQRYKEKEKAEIKKMDDWNNKMFYNKGVLDSQTHKDLPLEKLNDIKNMFNNVDPNLLEKLPIEHIKLIENVDYRRGYLFGISTLIVEKDVDEAGKKTEKTLNNFLMAEKLSLCTRFKNQKFW
jgi:hypothetical protein